MNDDVDLQFIDTNILVYAHDVSAGEKHTLAQDILRDLWQSGSGCLSVQVLQEFYVTLTQKVPNPLDPENAKRLVADIATWRVHSPQAEDVLGAIELQQRYQISFWDAMILYSSIQLKASELLSEDLSSDQIYDGIRVTNPFAVAS